ncbi:MAG: hypothetical protein DRN99_02645 [Thermoproteota archaeon]|nr:MAG: hypothetical protein DRN99_02645 [Candidatus Korarchaeota archaeon]
MELSFFRVLAHSAREKIVRMLAEEGPLTYKEIMEKTGIAETGKLNYHLERLSGFIEKREGVYVLTDSGWKLYELIKYRDEILAGRPPARERRRRPVLSRIGVVVCMCNGEVSKVISPSRLEEEAAKLEGVVSTMVFQNLCSPVSIERLAGWVRRLFINRLVIAACSPKLHAGVYQQIKAKVKVPVEVVNIVEHCAFVHQPGDKATEKAVAMLKAAVKSTGVEAYMPTKVVAVKKAVAVIGGGVSGILVSLQLAKLGFKVYLIERAPTIGGLLARWSRVGKGDCASCLVSELASSLVLHENVEIMTNTEVVGISGEVGSYEIRLLRKPRYVNIEKCTGCGTCALVCPRERPSEFEFGMTSRKVIQIPYSTAYPYAPFISPEDIELCLSCRKCEETCPANAIDLTMKEKEDKISVGAVVLATGGELYSGPLLEKYGYTLHEDIITSAEFERMLSLDGPTRGEIIKPSSGEKPLSIGILQCMTSKGCSRYCCSVAAKYLRVIREKLPDAIVHIIFDENNIPRDSVIPTEIWDSVIIGRGVRIRTENGRIIVEIGSKRVEVDLLILNLGLDPPSKLRELHYMLEFAVDERGFLDPRSLPYGFFACGAVTGPKSYEELVYESLATASEVALILSRDKLEVEEAKVVVDTELCGGCGLCEAVCPFNAVSRGDTGVYVDPFQCKGCGACLPACPTGALKFHQPSGKILQMVKALSTYDSKPKILAFCCSACGYPAADNAGLRRLKYNPNTFVLEVTCTGRIDSEFILEALKRGFDGVMIFGCRLGSCKYIDGIAKAKSRVEKLRDLLGEATGGRVRLVEISAIEGERFAREVDSFYRELAGCESGVRGKVGGNPA